MLVSDMVIQIPLIPNGFININDNGILRTVKTMLILAGMLGFPIPVSSPVDVISIALNICEKATAFKYDAAIIDVFISSIKSLRIGLFKNKNNIDIIKA